MSDDTSVPNQAANKEPAEGSRETVEANVMRNDARPMGHDEAPSSPIDPRDSVTHGRESHIVNKDVEERARREEQEERRPHENPTMPTGDSTLRTEI